MKISLTEQKRYVDAVMENVFNGIICIDSLGIIESFNSTAEKMFGYRAADVLGQNVKMLMPQQHREAHDGYLQRYLKTGERRIIGNLRQLEGQRKDGSRFPMELAVTETQVGEHPFFIGTIRDISDQKRAERELNAARQKYFHQEKMAAIGNLAAGIVHEIGNPIAAIAGLLNGICEASLRNDIEPVALQDNLQLVMEQVERIVHITRDVSEFANPQGEELQLVDTNNLIGRTCRLMRHDHRFQGIDVVMDLDAQIPAVFGVGDHVIQIVMNLLSNAADAVGEVPERDAVITLRSRRSGRFVSIEVNDNGCGMAPDTLRHATEAFYTTKPVGKGTGLGLSLCHALVTAGGGDMQIHSQQGIGTAVHVLLPINPSG